MTKVRHNDKIPFLDQKNVKMNDITNIKQREVRSEERDSKYYNPRRKYTHSKLLAQTKNINQQASEEHQTDYNKNLYYLQFLSGQAVWSHIRDNNQTENKSTENSNIQHKQSELILDKQASYDLLNKPFEEENPSEQKIKQYQSIYGKPKGNKIKNCAYKSKPRAKPSNISQNMQIQSNYKIGTQVPF